MYGKKIFLSLLSAAFTLLLALNLLAVAGADTHADRGVRDKFENYYEWQSDCKYLMPYAPNRECRFETALSLELFEKALKEHTQILKKQLKSGWLNMKRHLFTSFFNKKQECFGYAQKLVVPPGARIAIHGDFHGDIHSINNFIHGWMRAGYMDEKNPFKIRHPQFYILFLGDFVDRGWYGAEVIYTVLKLKAHNPDRVFIVRGNHEDVRLNERYGFSDELYQKFGTEKLIKKIDEFYNSLPVVLYLCCGDHEQMNAIQCCHGGIELGYDPRPLLSAPAGIHYERIKTLDYSDGFGILYKVFPNSLKPFVNDFANPRSFGRINGFMWNDFIVTGNNLMDFSPRGRHIYEFGRTLTEQIMEHWSSFNIKLRAVFRAHQHDGRPTPMRQRILNEDELSNPDDAGIGKLWIDDLPMHRKNASLLHGVRAVTFSVSPRVPGYNMPYDAFGLLSTAEKFDDWRLRTFRLSVEDPY